MQTAEGLAALNAGTGTQLSRKLYQTRAFYLSLCKIWIQGRQNAFQNKFIQDIDGVPELMTKASQAMTGLDRHASAVVCHDAAVKRNSSF